MSIELKNINKSFGTFTALANVTLTIPTGQLMALLGPSGSGKTTLLRIIAGLEQPDASPDVELSFDGQPTLGARVRERGVGFVFQHYALFRHMTVAENIAFGLQVRPRSLRPSKAAIREKVQALLELVQLQNLERRYPSQLSGGQRQRVALARALAVEPKILLLDEPFGALDARVRQELRRWLRKLHDEIHVTSVFVTHDQEEALEVADQIVVMNRGKIEQVGTPDEVFHKPASEFVMKFLGNVNLFHGRVESGQAMIGAVASGSPTGARVQPARLLVRPHELEVTAQPNGRPGLPATIHRIQSAGPMVKLELIDEHGQTLLAEMGHEQFHGLGKGLNQQVYVSPKETRVFIDDYTI